MILNTSKLKTALDAVLSSLVDPEKSASVKYELQLDAADSLLSGNNKVFSSFGLERCPHQNLVNLA